MRTNIVIDPGLLDAAMRAGTYKTKEPRNQETKKDAVEAGLKLLARQAAYREVLRWEGKLPWAHDTHADTTADTTADTHADTTGDRIGRTAASTTNPAGTHIGTAADAADPAHGATVRFTGDGSVHAPPPSVQQKPVPNLRRPRG